MGRAGKPSALQMMPIEMEIGRREGVTFAINSPMNSEGEKSAENSLFVDFLRFILIAAVDFLINSLRKPDAKL